VKKKVGIAVGLIINLGLIYVLIMWPFLSYGLVVFPMGYENGIVVSVDIMWELIIWLVPITILIAIINYMIFTKWLTLSKPSILVLWVVFTHFITGGISTYIARIEFLNYHANIPGLLSQYINLKKIITM